MDLDYSSAGIMAALFVSSLGSGLFIYGKKQRRAPQFVVGVLMVIYPIAIHGAAMIMAVCAGLLGVLWFVGRTGA